MSSPMHLNFTPGGGSITVQMRNSDYTDDALIGCANIVITDTGPGIPEHALPLIFNRYYQIHSTDAYQYEGVGIGLALAKELIELHHGRLDVTSEVGKGSAFTIVLPLGHAHIKNSELIEDLHDEPIETQLNTDSFANDNSLLRPVSVPVTGRDSSGDDRSVVLIVEDNADVRAFISDIIGDEYIVWAVADGAEGIRIAQAHIPDLIISDVIMPKIDGFTLCRDLKLDVRTSHIPVILLTGKTEFVNKLTGLEYGADDYVTKPFDPVELLARMKNLLEQRQRLRESFRIEFLIRPNAVPPETYESLDDKFLRTVYRAIDANIGNEHFDVDALSRACAVSRSQMHRKIHALTNHSAGDLIRMVRLERAMAILRQHAGSVAEVAYAVGFSNPSYFTKCFHDRFGIPPGKVK